MKDDHQHEQLRDTIAKAIADSIGHGMREKCERHADAVMAILDAEGDGGAVAWVADLAPGIERPKEYMGIFTPHKNYAGHLAKHPNYVVTPLYTHPARSGGVSDADVEAACRAYIAADRFLLDGAVDSMREPMRAALTHFAEGAEVGGDVEDAEDAARYRWLRDNCQPGANSNDKPHALVKVCVGTVDNRVGWFSLIGSKAHVGIVTLDQAIDAARKGERHDSIGG